MITESGRLRHNPTRGPGPLDHYKRQLKDKAFVSDPAQQAAITALEALFWRLIERTERQNKWPGWLRPLLGGNEAPGGLYFWGRSGTGKTFLLDCFYQCLPFKNKSRCHFHRFMQDIHTQLRQLGDVENPLQIIADRIAARSCILCFDEFHVTDITDAMLLGGLLRGLFERNVALVTTSNQHPDQLYRDGLQRERFLPAIALLKTHTEVLNVDAGVDYRLRFLRHAEIYHSPLDESAAAMLLNHYRHVCRGEDKAAGTIEIAGRPIPTVRSADGVIWFDFMALCAGPRGAADYIEIARQFHTVLLANIPIMDDRHDDMARRFITLIDEFYDRNVKLIGTAAAGPRALYNGRRLREMFRRTSSRLAEMQSLDYLARPHLP